MTGLELNSKGSADSACTKVAARDNDGSGVLHCDEETLVDSTDKVAEVCVHSAENVAESDDDVTEVHSGGEEFLTEMTKKRTCKVASIGVPHLTSRGLVPKNKGA